MFNQRITTLQRFLCLGVSSAFLVNSGCSSSRLEDFTETSETTDDAVSDVALPDADRIDVLTPDADPSDLPLNPDTNGACTEPGGFLCSCEENADCNSTLCVPSSAGGNVCTETCIEDCPAGWACRPGALGSADTTFICVDRRIELCRPCTAQSDCQLPGFSSPEDRCIVFGDLDGAFCGNACRPEAADADCPAGYTCQDMPSLGSPDERTPQCVPVDGTCACSGRAIQQRATTACADAPCSGQRVCLATGLTPCDAPEPSAEICDGLDNDCSGVTDDAFPDLDRDGIADCVDPDIDGDTVPNDTDNCVNTANPDQRDTDGNGIGDACDPPAMPEVLATTPVSPANVNTPVVTGRARPLHTVTLFSDPNCTTPLGTTLALPDGTFAFSATVADNSITTFYATARNDGGLASACSNTSVTYIEDSTAPAPPRFVGTTPGSPSQTITNPIVTGLAEAISTVTLYTNATCTAPAAATTETGTQGVFLASVNVEEGSSTTFFATATDAAGNVSACSTDSITYVHIAGPIDTFLTSGPSNPSTSTTATFWFIATLAEATFVCSLDAAPFTACTSPATYVDLTSGSHRFRVAAINAAGQRDPTPATFDWQIDTAPPQTTLVSVPPDPSNDATPTFVFTVSEPGSTTVCRIDSAPFVVCSSPWTAPALTDGFHTIQLLSTDAAGNQEPVPTNYRWRVDTIPPETTLTPLDFGTLTNRASVAFGLASTEPGSYICTVNGVTVACPTSAGRLDLAGLADGERVVSVAAVDEAGNVDPTPATYTFTVDRTPPETRFVGELPQSLSSTTAVSIAFDSNDTTATFECRLNNGGWSSCSSPWATTLGGGAWTFAVRAVDPAGNADPTPATVNFVIDNAPPDTYFTERPPSLTNVASPRFGFASNALDVAGFLCWLDGDGPFDCASPLVLDDLEEGPHIFEVAAFDAVNNIDPTPATWTFVVDSIPPDAPLGLVATAGNRRVSLTWEPVADAVAYVVRYGPTPAETPLPTTRQVTTTTTTITGLLNCINYVFEVVAVDAAGNVSVASNRVDATPVLPTPPSLVVGGDGLVSVRWQAVENATGYRVRYGATAGGPYDGVAAFEGASPVDVPAAGTQPFVLRGLPADRDVHVVVAALDGACESAPGTEHRTDPYPWDWVAPGPTGNTLRAVSCDGTACVAAGQAGTVLYTADPAAGWTRGNGGTSQAFVSVRHVDATTVIAVAGNTIHRSTDGGAIFRAVLVAPGTLARVSFVGTTGWAVGAGGRIFRTIDGGQSWVQQESGTTGDLSAVYAVSDTTAWVAGAGGTLLRTTDGSTWSAIDGPILDRIHDLVCSDGVTCWGVGAAGAVIRTTTGTVWTALSPRPTSQALVGVSRGAGGILRAVGAANTALVSTNDGASWAAVSGVAAVNQDQLFGLAHIGADALIVGEKGTLVRMATVGAAQVPTSLQSGFGLGDLRAIAKSGDGPLLVAGGGGVHALDVAARTLETLVTTTGTMRAVSLDASGFGMAVGDSGQARRTSDHGATWASVAVGLNEELRAVSCVGSTCWVAGSGNIIRRTTDGGDNWAPRSGVGGTRALLFFDALNGVMAIDNSFANASNYTGALNSVDGGTNWTSWLNYSNGRAFVGTSLADAIYVGGGGSNWCVEKAGLGTGGGGESAAIFERNAQGNWQSVHSATVDGAGDCFLAATRRTGGKLYAGGGQGVLSRDVPAPFNWVQMAPPTRERDIYGLLELAPGQVVAVGERGMVLVTTTGGL